MSDLPPSAKMLQMLSGYQVSQALYTMAELNVPTLLLQGPLTVQQLAEATDANTDALRRVIRSLEPIGVFRMDEDTVEVTELGTTLADGLPHSVRAVARFWMHTHYAPFNDLLHNVKTGENAATHFFGKPFFDWIAEDPQRVEIQNAAMSSVGLRGSALDGYRLPGTGTVADIGGADGSHLVQLLSDDDTPNRGGIVFDLPEVVAAAHSRIAAAGLSERIGVVGGDFFDGVPTADAYFMSVVLHDWDDDKSVQILRNIAKAAPDGARLVLAEMVIPEDGSPHPAKVLDVAMMALFGGRERTAKEWSALLHAGGFTLDRIIERPSPVWLIEATRS